MEHPLRLPGAALGAAWRALTARVGRSVRTPSSDAQLHPPIEADATPSSVLAIQRRRYESGVHFIVSGELDAVTAPQLRRQCERVDPSEAETVLLDLADLATMDEHGLDALFAAYDHFGERLVIIIGHHGAHQVELASARDVLPIIEG